MRLTFLGTGSAMPDGSRFQTGLLLEAGSASLLVDCGSGVVHGLQRTDVGYEGIDALVLTHHHLDHVADLLPLLKARWLAGEPSLTVLGPEGTDALLSDLLDVHDYLRDRVDVTCREIGPTGEGPTADQDLHEIGEFSVAAAETTHSMYCLAYRIHAGESAVPAVVYSGDTEARTDLIEFADGASVLAHDCSFPDEVDVDNHPTPSSLGTALGEADADVGRVYLTHLYPHTNGEHEAMLESIARHYDGDVEFAEDGLVVDLSRRQG